MPTRRSFLSLSARLAATGCLLRSASPLLAAPEPGLTYGVQMFMVRAMAQKDLAAAFTAIKQAGFDQVELYPIAYHQPPAQLRKLLGDTGLTSVSGHFDYGALDKSVDYAHDLGLHYLVCPMLPEAQKLSLAGFHTAAAWFNPIAERAPKAGMQFVFHNHDYEFKPLSSPEPGGSNGWTVLMKETDPNLVKLELDVFWLTTAGLNPAEMLRRHADRAVLLHMKDRVAGAPQSFVVDEKGHVLLHRTRPGHHGLARPAQTGPRPGHPLRLPRSGRHQAERGGQHEAKPRVSPQARYIELSASFSLLSSRRDLLRF